jgi:hypothetical protein
MGFEDFLKYLSQEMGIAAAVNAILLIVGSYAVEFWPWFCNLTPRKARLIFMIPLSFVLPVTATAVGVLYYAWPMQFDVTWWPALVAGFTAAFAGTVAHSRKL